MKNSDSDSDSDSESVNVRIQIIKNVNALFCKNNDTANRSTNKIENNALDIVFNDLKFPKLSHDFLWHEVNDYDLDELTVQDAKQVVTQSIHDDHF